MTSSRTPLFVCVASSMLVGLVASFATAWACTALHFRNWHRYTSGVASSDANAPTTDFGWVENKWPVIVVTHESTTGIRARGISVDKSRASTTREHQISLESPLQPPQDAEWWVIGQTKAGLPFKCVRGDAMTYGPKLGPLQTASRGFFRFGSGSDGDKYPYQPIWGGLALNTMAYGTAMFCVFALFRRIRVRRRLRKGLCVVCGYDISGIAVCPECGILPHSPSN